MLTRAPDDGFSRIVIGPVPAFDEDWEALDEISCESIPALRLHAKIDAEIPAAPSVRRKFRRDIIVESLCGDIGKMFLPY